MVEDYLEDLEQLPAGLSREKEQRLAGRIQEGDQEARNELVEANLRYAVKEAKRFQRDGIEFSDLIAEANTGLVIAANKFDPDRDVKFISYAVHWVRQRLRRAIAQLGGSVRGRAREQNIKRKIRDTREALRNELDRNPTLREISEAADIELKTIRQMDLDLHNGFSLDAPRFDNEANGVSRQESFSTDDGRDAERRVEKREFRECLEQAFLDHLDDREQKILVLYYGLDEGRPMTLRGIGECFGVSRERIRQLARRAEKKLQNSSAAPILQQFREPDSNMTKLERSPR